MGAGEVLLLQAAPPPPALYAGATNHAATDHLATSNVDDALRKAAARLAVRAVQTVEVDGVEAEALDLMGQASSPNRAVRAVRTTRCNSREFNASQCCDVVVAFHPGTRRLAATGVESTSWVLNTSMPDGDGIVQSIQ